MSQKKLWRPAIEFNLTEHCNLKCAHCDHASPMMKSDFADLDSFTRDIEVLATVIEAGEFKFAGGEPLLHPQLLDFLRVARRVGIANRLVLLTNGVLLHKAPEEMWDLIGGMWISLYPGVKYRFDWDWVQQKADEHNIFVWRKETPTFVESSLIEEIKSDEFVKMVYQNCDRAHLFSCHTIYKGRYYLCEPSVWMEPRLAGHGVEFANREVDSVAIHDNPRLYDEIDAMIRRNDEPLKACRFCLGSWARSTPNQQLSRPGMVEFTSRKPDALSDLVNPVWIVPRPYLEQNQG